MIAYHTETQRFSDMVNTSIEVMNRLILNSTLPLEGELDKLYCEDESLSNKLLDTTTIESTIDYLKNINNRIVDMQEKTFESIASSYKKMCHHSEQKDLHNILCDNIVNIILDRYKEITPTPYNSDEEYIPEN